MPTRRPTISESARLVNSAIRWAAASVSFITCGRGRGFGLDPGVEGFGVMFVIGSPNIEDETGLVAHPVRRPRRVPDEIDVDDAYSGHAGHRVLHTLRQLSCGRT